MPVNGGRQRRIRRMWWAFGSQSPASVVVCLAGLGLMFACVFADGLGLGDSPGLGKGQVLGMAAGFVLAVVGFAGATSH